MTAPDVHLAAEWTAGRDWRQHRIWPGKSVFFNMNCRLGSHCNKKRQTDICTSESHSLDREKPGNKTGPDIESAKAPFCALLSSWLRVSPLHSAGTGRWCGWRAGGEEGRDVYGWLSTADCSFSIDNGTRKDPAKIT